MKYRGPMRWHLCISWRPLQIMNCHNCHFTLHPVWLCVVIVYTRSVTLCRWMVAVLASLAASPYSSFLVSAWGRRRVRAISWTVCVCLFVVTIKGLVGNTVQDPEGKGSLRTSALFNHYGACMHNRTCAQMCAWTYKCGSYARPYFCIDS